MFRGPSPTLAVVLLTVSVAGTGFVANVAASHVPQSWQPYLGFSWPLFGVMIGLTVLFTLRHNALPREGDLVAARARFDRMKLTANAVDELNAFATTRALRSWLVGYLADQVGHCRHRRADPTERYWAYSVLGQLGTRRGRKTLDAGLLDEDEFARRGASEARERLRDSPRR